MLAKVLHAVKLVSGYRWAGNYGQRGDWAGKMIDSNGEFVFSNMISYETFVGMLANDVYLISWALKLVVDRLRNKDHIAIGREMVVGSNGR